MKKVHAMIDFETMGLSENAAIIQAGACIFDIETGEIRDTFQRGVSLRESQQRGFDIEAGTVMWWMSQSDKARIAVMQNEASMLTVFSELSDFLHCADFIWALGDRDSLWLTNHQNRLGLVCTPHRKFVNMRTVEAMGYEWVDVPDVGTGHTALNDCIYQVDRLTATMNCLGR